MPYRYLEHIGDAAVEGVGRTLEEAFAGAAEGMLALMVRGTPPAKGRPAAVEARASSLDELLAAFLNELLARQGLLGVVFFRCAVREVSRLGDGGYLLKAEAEGLPPGETGTELGAEVKAASHLGLRVEERDGLFAARVVLDM